MSNAELELIWRESHTRLLAYVSSRVARRQDAEDVLQDALVRIIRNRETLGDARSVSGWIWTVVRSALVDHHRAVARQRGTVSDVIVDLAGDDDDDAAATTRVELAACLRPMVEALSPPLREAVTLVELNGDSQANAARSLGVAASTLKSRVQRGRAQLREMLDACCTIALDGRGSPMAADRANSSCACDPCAGEPA